MQRRNAIFDFSHNDAVRQMLISDGVGIVHTTGKYDALNTQDMFSTKNAMGALHVVNRTSCIEVRVHAKVC